MPLLVSKMQSQLNTKKIYTSTAHTEASGAAEERGEREVLQSDRISSSRRKKGKRDRASTLVPQPRKKICWKEDGSTPIQGHGVQATGGEERRSDGDCCELRGRTAWKGRVRDRLSVPDNAEGQDGVGRAKALPALSAFGQEGRKEEIAPKCNSLSSARVEKKKRSKIYRYWVLYTRRRRQKEKSELWESIALDRTPKKKGLSQRWPA